MKSSPQPSKTAIFIGYSKTPIKLGPLHTQDFEVPITGLVHDQPFLTTAYISVGSRLKVFIDPVMPVNVQAKRKKNAPRNKKKG